MTAYVAPLADMRFVMRQIANMKAVRALPGYSDVTDDLVDAILEGAGRLAAEVLAPLNATGDRQGCILANGVVRVPEGFVDAYRQFVAGGWNSIALPSEYGGQGLLLPSHDRRRRNMERRQPGVRGVSDTHAGGGGTAAASRRPTNARRVSAEAGIGRMDRHDAVDRGAGWLGPCARAHQGAARGRPLPYLRTDLHHLRRARPGAEHHPRRPGPYPGRTRGQQGSFTILVPKFLVKADGRLGPRNDVRCVSIENKMGIKATPTAMMSLGDDSGAIGFLIGEENRGLELMFTMMNNARLAVGLEGEGIADRAFQQARSYAFERVQGRQLGNDDPDAVPIVRHPDVQRMLLTMKSQTEAARALAYFTAAVLDMARRHPDDDARRRHQQLIDLLTPVVKAGAPISASMSRIPPSRCRAEQDISRRAAHPSSCAIPGSRPYMREQTAYRLWIWSAAKSRETGGRGSRADRRYSL